MPKNSVLLLGYGVDDFDELRRLAETHKSAGWGRTKGTREGDELWFYIGAPHSAIVAVGKAMKDARPGRSWPYETKIGRIRWLHSSLPLEELRTLFPRWAWTKRAHGNTLLDEKIAQGLRNRLKNAGTKSKDEPPAIEPSKGDAKNNRKFDLRLIEERRGQPKFRKQLIRAYGCACAVTGCDAEPALEAAHIRPYCNGAESHVTNGLLLRADIHTLFDLGEIRIDPVSLKVRLSKRLNKSNYGDSEGKPLRRPANKHDAPDQGALRERWQASKTR